MRPTAAELGQAGVHAPLLVADGGTRLPLERVTLDASGLAEVRLRSLVLRLVGQGYDLATLDIHGLREGLLDSVRLVAPQWVGGLPS
jgi:hypothetical protein